MRAYFHCLIMQMVTREMVLVRSINTESFPMLKKWVCLLQAVHKLTLKGLFPTQRHNKPHYTVLHEEDSAFYFLFME